MAALTFACHCVIHLSADLDQWKMDLQMDAVSAGVGSCGVVNVWGGGVGGGIRESNSHTPIYPRLLFAFVVSAVW